MLFFAIFFISTSFPTPWHLQQTVFNWKAELVSHPINQSQIKFIIMSNKMILFWHHQQNLPCWRLILHPIFLLFFFFLFLNGLKLHCTIYYDVSSRSEVGVWWLWRYQPFNTRMPSAFPNQCLLISYLPLLKFEGTEPKCGDGKEWRGCRMVAAMLNAKILARLVGPNNVMWLGEEDL